VAFVGTPAGQESVCVCAEPAALVTALPVKVGAACVGTPAGHESVCVCAEPAPEEATAALVVLAVPAALTAVAACVEPVPNVATAICRMVVVEGICHGRSCLCADSLAAVGTPAGHAIAGALFVPAAVTECV